MSVMCPRAWSCLGSGLLWLVAVSACGTLPPTSVENKCEPAVVDSGVMQSLQIQIKERDKRIAELESQLDALKVIDQDTEPRRKFVRPPAILTPPATEQSP